ncbi:MAG: 3-hydroxyacyl-CoA dehydrogenase family protein [Promethearchaeota archaeon]
MSKITRTAVLGAGAMGHGIAQVFAQAGCDVELYDIDEKALSQVKDKINANLLFLQRRRAIARETIPFTLTRINLEPDFDAAVSRANLILEAVPERLDLKREIFAQAERVCRKTAILSSTTSVIRVGDIAEGLKTPERLVGTHWMNPPYVLPLVEIIRAPQTKKTVVNRVQKFLEEQCGKRTITCNDAPGFIVNRLAGAVLTEAAALIEEGVASHVEIDRAFKEHLGPVFLQYGPFGNLDYIGLDVIVLAAKYLSWALDDERYKLPKWLEDTVLKGNLGIKSGKGIYDYHNQSPEQLRQKRAEELLILLQKVGLKTYQK